MIAQTLLLVSLAVAGLLPQANGRIQGTVVNASQAKPSPCQATVLLRVLLEGQFVPFRETTSDAEGRFQFDSLPLGDPYRYLVGANRHGIHYPGPRIQLTESRPDATVELSVRDAVTHPNPLLIRKLEITICPEPGTLKVTESMLVENPSATCYVGQSPAPGARPVTLQLAIPSDFERTTFEEEFFGRRFSVVAGKLVTGVPWPPGVRALKYTYVLRNAAVNRHWEAPARLALLPGSPARVPRETRPGGLRSSPAARPPPRRSGLRVQRAGIACRARHSRHPGTPAAALDGPGPLGGGCRSDRPDCGNQGRHDLATAPGKTLACPGIASDRLAAAGPADRSRRRERRPAATSSPLPGRPRGTR